MTSPRPRRGEWPRFAELPVRSGAPPGSSWGVFGDDDEIGTVNFIGSEQVLAAAALVRKGRVFSLNWDLGLPEPPFFMRKHVEHTLFDKYEGGWVLDDFFDSFYPQVSTQWDGLRHVADPDFGWYNGATHDEVSPTGPGRLGIEHWARRGIAARGVLLDLARAVGPDPFDFFAVGPDLVERIARDQGVELRQGDVLMLRTGWLEAYERLTPAERVELAQERPASPGFYGDEIPGFLWDNRIAAVAADNPALEAARPHTGADLSLHKTLIARLGMPLGEFWQLAPLAEDCADDGVYEVFLTSAPLNIGGAVGSPPNALALK